MSKLTAWLVLVFLGTSFVFFFVSGGGASAPMKNLLAQVGIEVGVAPNPYNTLSAQLNQEQSQLDAESSSLALREAALAASSTAAANAASPETAYLAAAVAATGFLVALNFYLDWRRSRRDAI